MRWVFIAAAVAAVAYGRLRRAGVGAVPHSSTPFEGGNPMSDKKLVALEIRDARETGYAAVWDLLENVRLHTDGHGYEWVQVSTVWRAMYAYQEATERALLGDDAPPPGDIR